MITLDNIVSHELIGQHTEVVHSSNPQIIGLNGTIIDETKSMLRISTKSGIKSIPKTINSWKFMIGNHEKILEGAKIAKRPIERIGVKA